MVAKVPTGDGESAAECWKRIGVFGDRSCERLAEEVHCRNCDVYCAGGRALLDRPMPEDYLQDLTRQLAEQAPIHDDAVLTLVLFRLAGAWLALPSKTCTRTLPILKVVRVPGKRHPVFQGMVNAQGEIHLCVSLAPLLEQEMAKPVVDVSARVFPRMLETVLMGKSWIFMADEVVGSIDCAPASLKEVPEETGAVNEQLITGRFGWYGLKVALLDPDVLARRFEESLA
jgi:chemotaxis-related protein WspD